MRRGDEQKTCLQAYWRENTYMSGKPSRHRLVGWGVIALGFAGFVAINVAVAKEPAPPSRLDQTEDVHYRTLDRMISGFAAEARARCQPR